MKNIENLFNNIRYSQELFIEELVKRIQPDTSNKVSVNDICRVVGVNREEGSNALKALSIAEVIVSVGITCKHTEILIVDIDTFNKIRERVGSCNE